MDDCVKVSREGPVTHITLNRTDKLNAFNVELVDQAYAAVMDAHSNGTRLAVISGAGKGFSGGFDLDGIDAESDGDMLLRFVRVEQLLQAVYHAPFATLSLAHGACYGAAADLISVCHHRVAAPGARFRMPGPKFDVVLGTRRLTNLVGADRARTLILRERPFDHDEALAAGYVQEIAEQAKWPDIIASNLERALGFSPTVQQAINARTAQDTREADMAALVHSVTNGSITQRLKAYLEAVKSARR
ncbi:MAG: enoyl-CoA hydratase/isomerase family protein [Gammaproteobacteria bacterium]|nr:enoyl-CoA hydratase/isomerase family protein [Gammaproteobacteria bacterium]